MNQKIKVLHVGIDSRLGGIETYLKKITTYIDKERYQFDFLSYKGVKPYFYEELTNLGGKFHFICSRRENMFRNKKELHQLFETEKYDIVHCHFNSLSYITPCLIALKYNCKVIVHSRNAGNLQSKKSRLLHNINYFRLKNKRNITRVAVSDLAGKWMFGNAEFTVLNNGLDTEQYKYSEEYRKEVRKELEIDGDQEIILNVGALRPQKNHKFIIKIFKEYCNKNTNSKLILIGEGSLHDEVVEEISKNDLNDNVLLLGNRSDVYKILSAADKFLFPSFYEGFPNALIEAETSGLYCVVSDTITRQAIIDELANSISLNQPVDVWVNALEKKIKIKREECTDLIKKRELDIESEIKRLETLYNNIKYAKEI